MVAKDVSKGGQGEVVVGGKVGIVGSENGERGAVQEICGEGVAEARREVIWESFDTMERRKVIWESSNMVERRVVDC